MSEPAGTASAKWSSAWVDGLAFAAGLALAWFGQWETRDLVWSLWLSSLLVGYAMIVWSSFGPGVRIAVSAWRDRALLSAGDTGKAAAFGAISLVGGLFVLAFFTVHFGMFHFVHSVFLNVFFPALPVTGAHNPSPSLSLYQHVLASYWPFVLVTAVAERNAFRAPPEPAEPDTSVKAADIAARKLRLAKQGGMTGMMAPYRNVVRLHLLIFFFAGAYAAKLNSFIVYAVVYAVYFFPWRLLRREKAEASAPA